MAKLDLPDLLVDEYIIYDNLYKLGAERSTTGNLSFMSSSSGLTYTSTTGQLGILQSLQTALNVYIISATDFNTVDNKIGDLTLLDTTIRTDLVSAINEHLVNDASETVKGHIELATAVDIVDGTDTTKAVTPVGLSSAITTHNTAATEVLAAHVELATQAEASTGTDTGRVITPATVKGLWTHVAVASDTLRGSLGNEVGTQSTTYVKKKQFTINASGTFRIKFTLRTNNSDYHVYGRVYKNGVAFGTERSMQSATGVEYSEDLAFNAGDTCEIWIRYQNASYWGYVSSFRIYFDMTRTFAGFNITPELPVGADV
jgi:hypothetical protein